MQDRRILISGAGIAGLTLATLLKERGFDPVVIERQPSPSRTGYMMDFFGTGWDVAERMNLVSDLRAIHYPIERLEFVDAGGKTFHSVPIDRVRNALNRRYVYLRRPDLEAILLKRARENGVEVRYDNSVAALEQDDGGVTARLESGDTQEADLVFGADGVHSNIRKLVFGPETDFARFLGYYVAAFHIPISGYGIGDAIKIYEEPDRTMWVYPLNDQVGDAVFMFRHAELKDLPHDQRLPLLRRQFGTSGWIAADALRKVSDDQPIFFDTLSEIVMPEWHRGRVALLGDACGCLTLAAGQGSHLAMADAYVLAQQLDGKSSHDAAFDAYQQLLKPHVERKQRDAARFADMMVPSGDSHPAMRRLAIRLMFSGPALGLVFRFFGAQSVLPPVPRRY